MTLHVRRLAGTASVAVLALVFTACTCSPDDTARPTPAPSVVAPLTSVRPALTATKPGLDHIIRLPSGPPLEILAGQGVGAIRLGATVPTIERLMGTPCEFKTDTACRYVGRAVEFFLDDQGATKEIHIHRVERPTTPEGRTFGVFNGRMANSLTLMMIPTGVKGLIGPPLKTEQVTNGGPAGTVEIDDYDGLRIEYDKLPPDRTVVGGIDIVKGSQTGAPSYPSAHAAAASAPGAPAKPKHVEIH
ncbi:MAG TPA: hypothetical protein VH062_00820 [Polyangiaceae bacterium]|jgi:hypothetical protein|nr:hypothetical protein [Polyangiaceae bacterium]